MNSKFSLFCEENIYYFKKNIKCFCLYLHKILSMDIINIISIVLIIVLLFFLTVAFRKDVKSKDDAVDKMKNSNESNEASLKLMMPLKIQACERLLLYVERIYFPVLVKRVFMPAMSRNDFHFSILQNVQDEFEHNLAQRLYVSETTWQLIVLAKEEVLQNVNAVFNDNPDVDVAMIAHKIASFENPMGEKAIVSIKNEVNSL